MQVVAVGWNIWQGWIVNAAIGDPRAEGCRFCIHDPVEHFMDVDGSQLWAGEEFERRETVDQAFDAPSLVADQLQQLPVITLAPAEQQLGRSGNTRQGVLYFVAKHPAHARHARDAVFAELDLLVVPSLWWENSPLTIHEAFQRGVPVLTSDRGGMAELVARGGGRTFAPGDVDDLAARLAELARRPAAVDALAATIPPVRPLAEDVRLLEGLARR